MYISENLPQIILVIIVFLVLSLFVYIKLAFPFWNRQPVYHTYDFWRFIYRNPFRIHQRFSILMRSKFCEMKDVEIVPFVDATEGDKKVFVNILQCYSMESDRSLYMFHLNNLESYLGGHTFSSYISFYKMPLYKSLNKSMDNIIVSEQPVGCISSRSGELFIGGIRESIYYIDHLVIRRDRDHRGISRNLFETHIYKTNLISKMELLTEPIMVYLFRRDKELLSGIVPLVRFNITTYILPNNLDFYMQRRLPEHVLLTEIHGGNMDLLIDFLGSYREQFSVCAITDISNLIGLIKSGILFVYVLKRFDDILAVYIFRDTRIRDEDIGSVLDLVTSINIHPGVFYNGFLHALGSIIKKQSIFKILRVDGISDNNKIPWYDFYKIDEWSAAYYLYNFVVPNSPTNHAFILF